MSLGIFARFRFLSCLIFDMGLWTPGFWYRTIPHWVRIRKPLLRDKSLCGSYELVSPINEVCFAIVGILFVSRTCTKNYVVASSDRIFHDVEFRNLMHHKCCRKSPSSFKVKLTYPCYNDFKRSEVGKFLRCIRIPYMNTTTYTQMWKIASLRPQRDSVRRRPYMNTLGWDVSTYRTSGSHLFSTGFRIHSLVDYSNTEDVRSPILPWAVNTILLQVL